MKKWLVILLWPLGINAHTVQITEIAPHTLALQPEWFEFRVEGSEIFDLSQWQVGNGKNQPKKLAEHLDSLRPGDGVKATDDPLVFSMNDSGYFVLQPSPVSLPNDGGTIIFFKDQVEHARLDYPKAQSRSPQDYEEREVWHWSDEDGRLIPQLVRAPANAAYQPTPGQANPNLPTALDRYSIVINEVSIDNDPHDFIELKIIDGPERVNLQYLEVRHNGTRLWYFDQAVYAAKNDILTFQLGTTANGKMGEQRWQTSVGSGLSGGSGTVELIGLSGTSQEQILDVVCWQKDTLSQSENRRVQKYIDAEQWRGPCLNIDDLIPNESRARIVGGSDSNSAQDWWRHFNGSMGTTNQTQNQSPQAVISLQGTKKEVGEVPFQVNPTGAGSTDPDGPKDLKSYHWELNGKFLSDKANPPGFSIEAEGEHILQLTVTDQSGQTDSTEQLIVGISPLNRNHNRGSTKAKVAVAQAWLTSDPSPKKLEVHGQTSGFFDTFLQQENWLVAVLESQTEADTVQRVSIREQPKHNTIKMYEEDWPRRINLPIPVRQRAAKNLGILFSWREAPWPDLAAEWTAVVANDQKFGYFGGVYLGF